MRVAIEGHDLAWARGIDEHFRVCGNHHLALSLVAQAAQDIVKLLLKEDVQMGVGFIQQDQAGRPRKHERKDEQHLMKPAPRR